MYHSPVSVRISGVCPVIDCLPLWWFVPACHDPPCHCLWKYLWKLVNTGFAACLPSTGFRFSGTSISAVLGKIHLDRSLQEGSNPIILCGIKRKIIPLTQNDKVAENGITY